MTRLFFALSVLAFALWPACAQAAPESPSEIVLGMSTVLSGPAANLGNDMRQGVLAGLARANRAGGVHGRQLRLVALDDGYEPSRTAPNMRQLLEVEKVLAVIGNVGTPTAIAALPIAREQQTLFFAPFSGAGALRKEPPDRHVINFRASYAEEVGAMIDGLIGSGGIKAQEIAFFTQRDGYGDAGFDGAIAALRRYGLKDERSVLHVRYTRNTLAVENALASLLYAESQPRAVVMVGAYAPCAKFIKLAQESGLEAVFLNVSFVGSESLAMNLGDVSAKVIVTQVVPHPLDIGVPIVREFQSDLAAVDPRAAPCYGSLEGYIAARIFTRAIDAIAGVPTRASVISALENLGDFDLGLGLPLKLDAQHHQACHGVWPTIFERGAFVPFSWSSIGELVTREVR